jgi:homogentisate 1,2-dioxygenase
VTHKPFAESKNPLYAFIQSNFFDDSKLVITPNQLRWEPLPIPSVPTTFLEGFVTIAGAGDPSIKSGIAIHLYSANKSMENQAFYNSDGDFLIVPQLGTLYITTEFGLMTVKPREICVMPRGIKF